MRIPKDCGNLYSREDTPDVWWDLVRNSSDKGQAGQMLGFLLNFIGIKCQEGLHDLCTWRLGNWSVGCSCSCHPDNAGYPELMVDL